MTAPTEAAVGTHARPAPGLLIRAWQALRFRDAVLLTLLPVVVVLCLIGGSVYDYGRSIQFDDWFSASQSVPGIFHARMHALLGLPRSLALRHAMDPEARDAAIIRLEIPGRTWDSLEADPQAMWGSWVDGRLRTGGDLIPVQVRKRGDNSVHWLTDKRTITVRTPRDEFFKRYRSFGLSAKDPLTAYLANRMAPEFGLLVPNTDVVPVYLNNRFYGVFRFVELPDESFLRPFDRMPGNIFRADRAERGEYFKGVNRIVWENPALWDRTAVSDRWTNAGAGQLLLLLQDLHGQEFSDHQRMMARIDPEEFARLFAYLFFVGDPYHMDAVHNILIYEDPSTQLMHPVPWDIRLLDLARPQHPLNPWFRAVLSDPFVVDRTMQEIGRRVGDDRTFAVADSLVRTAERRNATYLAYDRGREGLVPEVGSADAAVGVLRKNIALLRRWTEDASVAYQSTVVGGQTLLDFETRGRVGADLVALRLDRRPVGTPMLRLDRNRDGVLDASDPAVALRVESSAEGARLVPSRPVALLAGWNTEGAAISAGHIPYRLFLTGVGAAVVTPELENRVTRKPAEVRDWEAGAAVRAPSAWHPWQFPELRGTTHVLSGEVRLDRTLRIPVGDTLVIQPGTTLHLAPDVSIVSRGPVFARGTQARPIRVIPQETGIPWGTFSLQGHGADNSVVTWTEFFQGGGALLDRIEYIGMINIHRTRNITFDHVTFRENLRSDDTFHSLHSEFRLTNSHFIKANSDAVDLDISTGLIQDNTFEATGGDAIDLMTSTPRIIGNFIKGAGDKGVSIGEASRPFVFANHIEGATRGIEVKDRSEPVILNNELVGNKVGLRMRRKNWRYGGGGWATIANTVFRESKTLQQGDPFSRLTLAGVVGLDSSVVSDSAPELGWLYARYGIQVSKPAPGLPAEWTTVPAVPPIDEARFTEDLKSVSDGWEPSGGTTELEKRRDALVLTTERSTGVAARAVDWRIAGPDSALLVLEVAGRDLDSARVVVSGDQGERSIRFRPSGDVELSRAATRAAGAIVPRAFAGTTPLSSFRFVELRLPPGHYTSLRIEATPSPGVSHIKRSTGLSVLRAGQLQFRGFALYPGPAAPAVAASPTP